MKKLLTSTLKFLVFFGIGSTILYLVYRSQNAAYLEQCAIDGIPEADCNLLLKVWTDIKNANYFWIGMILLAYTISNISRTERWMMLIKPMGYQPRWLNGFGTVMLGYFANLGLPRMGEVIRAGVFSKYENIPPEKVMGTVVTDRIVDFICFFIVIGCAFLLEFDTLYNFVAEQRNAANAEAGGTSWIEILLWVGGSLALVCGLLLLVFFRKIKETNIYKKVLNILEGFAEGIQTIKNLDRPGLFVFHSVMIWIMYFLMLYLGTFSFAPTTELGLSASLVIFTAGSLGMIIPSPGGMGSYHAMIIASCVLYGVSGNDGFSFANIMFFSVTIGANILLGILALIILPSYNKNYRP
ncbi:MAG: flippase-like domain-containing protein [Bacteroidetes bacterium]|jgi:uncharacterized protein (TIRG00374 family)|nr:flippase-like domain-containing protein [Bacteroidota bacterium]MDF1868098.1 lysylphosphatidylglycerol synthase transmembrane domain-containing protein [Saprospiraceae bacterium]